MATIAYSLAGEGRGHATRVLAAVEHLRKRHRIILYASRDGFELLSKAYAGGEVGVRRIPGLYYIYDSTGRTQNVMTALCALEFLCKLNGRARSLAAQLDREHVDLVISDFETIVTRAAESSQIPYIIFDHQHFLLTYDLRCLPLKLRLQAFSMKCAISIVSARRPVHTIVSSFFFPPLLSGLNNVTQIGTLVHPEIVSARVSDEGHVVAYFRRTLTPRCYQSLRHCGVDVHLYGLGEKARDGNIFYHPTDVHRFVESLAASRALVCSAGNQIIGEAFYLKKPVLAVPEPNNMEQRINGFFLGASRAGMCVLDHQIESKHVRNLVLNAEAFRHDGDSRNIDGTDTALRIVESCLSPASRRSHAESGSGTAPARANPGRETGS
jgi:uncharacterized protein (TIGR00661 family)